MKKKLMSLTMCAALGLSLLAGCGDQSSAASGERYNWLQEPWPWNYEQNEVK